MKTPIISRVIGLLVIIMLLLSSCDPEIENLPPIPGYKLRPPGGNTATIFTFDASESYDDKDSITDLKFRWDWQGDGKWDTDWSSEIVCYHRYLISGVYRIDLEVMDSEGATAECFEFVDVEKFFMIDIRDNREYNTVQIGEQLWMTENLKYMTYSGSWCHNDSVENCEKQGRIYDWYTAQTICPPGWKLPDQDDWDQLISYVGENSGDKLRSRSGWNTNNGTDNYGFNAKPAAYRHDYGAYTASDSYAYFWTAGSYSETTGWSRLMSYNKLDVETKHLHKDNAFSVRCLRNEF